MRDQTQDLTLNVAPVSFVTDRFTIGRLPFTTWDDLDMLRGQHWQTHVFRFDSRCNQVLNLPLLNGQDPIGETEEVDIHEHLLLAAIAIQRAVVLWISTKLPVISDTKRVVFWGQADEALLLTQAIKQCHEQPRSDLEVALRYEIDCRMFAPDGQQPFLGLVLDIRTANIVEVSLNELVRHHMTLAGRYACRRIDPERPYLHPPLELLGRIESLHGSQVTLSDERGSFEVDASDVILEPRSENLDAAVAALYPKNHRRILAKLRELRSPAGSATGKLDRANQTLEQLRRRRLTIANGVEVHLGDLLRDDMREFPAKIETSPPVLLFGPQGIDAGKFADKGIRDFGPYMYMQHAKTQPLIAVILEVHNRGTMEEFVEALCSGIREEQWQGTKGPNPFGGGLKGQFRLSQVRIEYEQTTGNSASDYRDATKRLLERLTALPDLAIVQIRESHAGLPPNADPYYATKALFMKAGVPTQAIKVEKTKSTDFQFPFLLRNFALASYAKMDGIPWVISTPRTTSHELVIGLGSSEVSTSRFSSAERYVGITTLFQGDGRYLVWGLTREVLASDYADALYQSLQGATKYVRDQSGWEPGDKIRLICHAYKRLKDSEVDAAKALTRDLLRDQYEVEFAFLDVSTYHPYRIIAPRQEGIVNRGQRKGKGVPPRGVCLQLDRRRVLLSLTGPSELMTEDQGLPVPLMMELHPDSDFVDMAYLARQAFHFSFASWQSFRPSAQPVTVKYSRRIAELLGNLRNVEAWDSTSLSVGALRGRRWFL